MSEDESLARINALLAELPADTAALLVLGCHQEAARMAAEPDQPPPLMRGPGFPWGLRGLNAQTAVYTCRQPGCGTVYVEVVDELPGPLVLPANFTGEDLAAAISAQASERSRLRLERVQREFTEHHRTAHPEVLEEIHGTPATAAR